MKKSFSTLIWILIALVGAWAYVTLAVRRGEPINSIYILLAALCSYTIGYRFYSKWVAARVLALNDRRATPCEVHEDGRDYVKTNKWIVFGHHFAAISGPGPLVGPVLAAQFGYLPGTLWILIGVVLGGAVQDFVILFASMRRDGKSLAQMVREELNKAAGVIGVVAILSIMIILLAVLALVVVKALAESPWGIFTVGATIPIAMFMGACLRFWRVGKVMEVSAAGVVLLLLAVWGGKFVYANAWWSDALTLSEETVAWSIILYGLAASILPVWLLLAPRDYLSTFMKLGTIFALVAGIFFTLPTLKMPAVTQFIDGSGLVFSGKLFPFCFITIACGAISGFHTLIASGITPKIITRESYARPVGYGAMCLESLVAIMAMIAACTLDPGTYLSMNVKGDPVAVVQKVTATGFPASVEQMEKLAATMGEKTLFNRTAGAATLAVGMAQIFAKFTQGRWLDLWYHFAIMFEALFILTTLDAGTRVGRYLLQDVLGNLWKPLGETRSILANALASVLVVAGWGYFLIQGVHDPLGGINSLWPIFGIANQLLASIALCLATTIILKMALRNGAPASDPARSGAVHSAGSETGAPRPALALITFVPLLWLLTVTGTAAVQKIWHHESRPSFARIGFLQIARELDDRRPALETAVLAARTAGAEATLKAAEEALGSNRAQSFNNKLDAAVTGFFLSLVVGIFLLSVREWVLLIARKKAAEPRETPPTWLPDYAVAEAKPFKLFSFLALSLALLKELSGESAVDRAQQHRTVCAQTLEVDLLGGGLKQPTRGEAYVAAAERRFEGPNRCC